MQAKLPKDVLHDIDLLKCSLEEGTSVQVGLMKYFIVSHFIALHVFKDLLPFFIVPAITILVFR